MLTTITSMCYRCTLPEHNLDCVSYNIVTIDKSKEFMSKLSEFLNRLIPNPLGGAKAYQEGSRELITHFESKAPQVIDPNRIEAILAGNPDFIDLSKNPIAAFEALHDVTDFLQARTDEGGVPVMLNVNEAGILAIEPLTNRGISPELVEVISRLQPPTRFPTVGVAVITYIRLGIRPRVLCNSFSNISCGYRNPSISLVGC